MSYVMPTIFFGHGNPMNALSRNSYTEGWAAVGRSIPRLKAVLVISAHWYIPSCSVTSSLTPRTIHDFGGFPEELYQVEYPASGCPELARQIEKLLAPTPVRLHKNWGLDHGAWSILKHLFPSADIPVVQLSIDETQPPNFHYEMGKRLIPLREEGVLILGSGNIVHNLTAYAWGNQNVYPFDWAIRFEEHVMDSLRKGNDSALIDYQSFGHAANLSVPTPEHYLPLLYMLGLRKENEQVCFPIQGVDGGSVSMLAVQIG